MAISVSFLLSRVVQPGARGPAFCWVLAFSTTSCHQRVTKLTNFLSSPSYIIVQSPTQYFWNGMFDRHQAEITLMQFTGHSLPEHQCMTVPWDFNLSHIVSQAHLQRFLPITAIGMYHFLPVHHFGMACWPGRRSIYNTNLSLSLLSVPPIRVPSMSKIEVTDFIMSKVFANETRVQSQVGLY